LHRTEERTGGKARQEKKDEAHQGRRPKQRHSRRTEKTMPGTGGKAIMAGKKKGRKKRWQFHKNIKGQEWPETLTRHGSRTR